MAPVTESLKTRYGKAAPLLIFTVGEPAYSQMAARYGVRATPTYVVIKDEKPVAKLEGAGYTLADFDAALDKLDIKPVKP